MTPRHREKIEHLKRSERKEGKERVGDERWGLLEGKKGEVDGGTNRDEQKEGLETVRSERGGRRGGKRRKKGSEGWVETCEEEGQGCGGWRRRGGEGEEEERVDFQLPSRPKLSSFFHLHTSSGSQQTLGTQDHSKT